MKNIIILNEFVKKVSFKYSGVITVEAIVKEIEYCNCIKTIDGKSYLVVYSKDYLKLLLLIDIDTNRINNLYPNYKRIKKIYTSNFLISKFKNH